MPGLLALLSCCVQPHNEYISPEMLRWQRRRNKEIENELRKEKARRRRRQMILLLGTGESGKSTFLKQTKIINGKHFSTQEITELKLIIYDNIYKGVLFLLQARESLTIPWEAGENCPASQCAIQMEDHFRSTRSIRRERGRMCKPFWTEEDFLALVPSMEIIWKDGAIRRAFDLRAKLVTENFSENTRYYLNRLNYIGVKDYMPTDEDIVWSRKPTQSIIEEEFIMQNTSIVFIDVGGQTKERRKWCQCFSDMTSVLFLIACSHYDEHYLDHVTKEYRNKLHEAMVVFEGLINHSAFRRVSVIIFFNKTDILKEKVASGQSSIREEFPNFPANADPFKLEDVQNFMVKTFASVVDQTPPAENIRGQGLSGASFSHRTKESLASPRRPSAIVASPDAVVHPDVNAVAVRRRLLYKHFTTAVDRRNIETVFHAMQDTVLQNNLRRILMG